MDLKNSTTYVVILFEKSQKKKLEVDLVPRSWLTLIDSQWVCRYPMPQDYHRIEKWVIESKVPKSGWMNVNVSIIKEAANYAEGIRRLTRSYSDSVVKSTSANESSPGKADQTQEGMPVILDDEGKNAELNQVPAINEDISGVRSDCEDDRQATPANASCPKETAEPDLIRKPTKTPDIRMTPELDKRAVTPDDLSEVGTDIRQKTPSNTSSSENQAKRKRTTSKLMQTPNAHMILESDKWPSTTDDSSEPEIHISRKRLFAAKLRQQVKNNRILTAIQSSSAQVTRGSRGGTMTPDDLSESEAEMRQKTTSCRVERRFHKNARNDQMQTPIKTHRTSKRAITRDTSDDDITPVVKKLKNRRTDELVDRSDKTKRHEPLLQTGSEASFDRKLKMMEDRIIGKIKSIKRSILYDIGKKSEQIKQTVVINGKVLGTSAADQRKALGIKLPITDLKDFIKFDTQVPEKEQAVKSMMTMATYGTHSIKEGVACIMKSLISKSVQQAYSGCGRKVKGEGKKNFSETKTFACMRDVLLEKHPDISLAEVVSRTSRWLSGWADRDGGRTVRLEGGSSGSALQKANSGLININNCN